MATEELIQNTVEIMDSAHRYRLELSGLLDNLTALEDQVCTSGDKAVATLTAYFGRIKEAINKAVDARLHELVKEVECMKEEALKPLKESRTLIGKSVDTASLVMEEGGSILSSDPEKNLERILRFKDNPNTKCLASFPELPSPSEVAYFTVETSSDVLEQLAALVTQEARVLKQPPVQILHMDEKPGGITVHWGEAEDDNDLSEFTLQYACGKPKENSKLVYHTAYEGPATSSTVKNLRTQTAYTFRVRGRCDKCAPWSAWSLSQVASTSIPHHCWAEAGESYSISNEGRTTTRTSEGLTQVLYSNGASYTAGDTLILRVLDSADVSPRDGLAIVSDNSDEDSCNRPGAIFINTYGKVFVDGNEMKTQLPGIKKGTTLTFQTERLPNGKVRVSVQVDDKEVTLDWRVAASKAMSLSSLQPGEPAFYFALRFAQEHWKVGVE